MGRLRLALFHRAERSGSIEDSPRAVMAMAWLFGRIALYVAIGYAMFLVLHGIAGGVAELCGHREWAGNLITGGLFLAGLGLALKIGSNRFVSLTQRRIQEHYEHRRRATNASTANTSAATAADAMSAPK